MNRKKFAKKLRRLRKSKGLTQRQVARELFEEVGAIDNSQISKWENAKSNLPSKPVFVALCKRFEKFLTPREGQQWASYAGMKLSLTELQDIFGGRYEDLERFLSDEEIWGSDDVVIEEMQEIGADIAFRQRLATLFNAYKSMLKHLQSLASGAQSCQSIFQQTKARLETLTSWERAFKTYQLWRHKQMKNLTTQVTLSLALFLGLDMLVTDVGFALMLFIAQILWAMVILYRYSTIVTAEEVYIERWKN